MKRSAHAALVLRYYVQAQPLMLRSEEEKRREVAHLAELYRLPVFVETGTYLGKTTLLLANVCERCVTIEVDPSLHERARSSLAHLDNVELLLGDSASLMPGVLEDLDVPALFWLDGHYSGGVTAHANKETPVLDELAAILDHPVKNHVVLIDDARLFRGSDGYPTVKRVRRMGEEKSPYQMRICNDIIRVYREDI